jgi:hypothetical protein
LGKAIGRGLTTAVANGQSQKWVAANGAWRDYRSVNLALDQAGNSLQIQATDASNQVFTGTVSVTNANLVSVRGTEGDSRLIRLLAHPNELTLTRSTTTSSSSGEGESNASTDAAMAQVSSQLLRMTSSTDEIASSQGSNDTESYESVYAQDIDELIRKKRS